MRVAKRVGIGAAAAAAVLAGLLAYGWIAGEHEVAERWRREHAAELSAP